MLYRALAIELDDEMPGIFSRPFRSGTLKFLCLEPARRAKPRNRRYTVSASSFISSSMTSGLESRRSELVAQVELCPRPAFGHIGPLGQELMLKLAHGVSSWLIGQKIPLLQVEFACARPPHAFDHRYFFAGPVRFGCDVTRMRFSAAFLDMPIRQSKRNLRKFLARSPDEWIFESFSEQLVSHRVRQYLAGELPDLPTIDQAASRLHCSVRTLCRRLAPRRRHFSCSRTNCGATLLFSG